MKCTSFKKAKPIYPSSYLEEMNISLLFEVDVDIKNNGKLVITGNSVFRIFDNGKLIGYGPCRAAHNYYRIDEYDLDNGFHHLVIELSGYNCNTYYVLNTPPFLQAEIFDGKELIKYTGENEDFKCYLNETRIRKVTRFAYQRAFSESYVSNIDFKSLYLEKIPFLQLKYDVYSDYRYLSRNVDYQKFIELSFEKIEEGNVQINKNKKCYEDRYMYLEHLCIFNKDEWEVNPNDFISQLDYYLLKKDELLDEMSFETYVLKNSKTGFLHIDIDVLEDSEIYFIFDEIDTSEISGIVDIKFYRNTTHNIISYKLGKGHYNHISFEPYTMKYLRVIVKYGKVKVNNLSFILYENPLNSNFSYDIKDNRIQLIFDAGVATFVQNAVDILTDCPSRERAGWLCDSYFSAKAEQLLFGENKVEYNFLENYALLDHYKTLPKGMVPMCYPGEYPDGNFIPNWAMFYILELKDYLYRTGDKKLLNLSINKIKGLLEYFKDFENEFGLLENLKGWIFVEWSKANDDDFVKGVNFPSNMVYASVLEASSELLGDKKLLIKANEIREKIRQYSFDGCFFRDNMVRTNHGFFHLQNNITETCQYYAFYFGVVTKDSHPELYNRMLTKFGPRRDHKIVFPDVHPSNVFIGDYLRLMILCSYNEYEKVKEESIDYFYNMAKITGTLWEHDSTFASLNHGLTSYILNILVEACFGYVKQDRKNKIIYLKELTRYEEGKIIIPLDQDNILEIEVKNNKRSIKVSEKYEIRVIN